MTDRNCQKFVLVRTSDQRYYAGFTDSFVPPLILEGCRQLVRWNAKTWFDLAVEGPLDAQECLFSAAVKRAYLADAVEIVECSKRAMWAVMDVLSPDNCERGEESYEDAQSL